MIINIIIYSLLLLVTSLIDKKWYSLRAWFYCVWILICVLYQLNIFPIYSISAFTSIIIGVSGVLFFLGSELANHYKLKPYKIEFVSIKTKQIVFVVFVFISLITLLRGSIKSIHGLMNGETFLSMKYKSEYKNFGITGIWVLFTYFIVNPLTYAIVPIAVLRWFREKDWKLLVVAIVIVGLYVLYRGERGPIFLFILSYFLMYFFDKNKSNLMTNGKIQFKSLGRGILLVIVFVIGISFINGITVSRGIVNAKESWYYYLCGCIPYLDYKLAKVDTYTFGGASFLGLINPPMYLLHGLGVLNPFPEWYNDLLSISSTSEFVRIGDSKQASINAFVGPAYYFYLDFGLIGVIFGMLLLGWVYHRIYRSLLSERSAKTICLYLLSAFGIVFSFERNWFFHGSYIIGFLFLIFFMGSYEKYIEEKKAMSI